MSAITPHTGASGAARAASSAVFERKDGAADESAFTSLVRELSQTRGAPTQPLAERNPTATAAADLEPPAEEDKQAIAVLSPTQAAFVSEEIAAHLAASAPSPATPQRQAGPEEATPGFAASPHPGESDFNSHVTPTTIEPRAIADTEAAGRAAHHVAGASPAHAQRADTRSHAAFAADVSSPIGPDAVPGGETGAGDGVKIEPSATIGPDAAGSSAYAIGQADSEPAVADQARLSTNGDSSAYASVIPGPISPSPMSLPSPEAPPVTPADGQTAATRLLPVQAGSDLAIIPSDAPDRAEFHKTPPFDAAKPVLPASAMSERDVTSAINAVRAWTFRAPAATVRPSTAAAVAHLRPVSTPPDHPGANDKSSSGALALSGALTGIAQAASPPGQPQPGDLSVNPTTPSSADASSFRGFQENLSLMGAQTVLAFSEADDPDLAAAEFRTAAKQAESAAPQIVKALDVELGSTGADPVAMKMRLRDGKLSVVIEAPNARSMKAIEAIRHDISERLGSGEHALDSLIIRPSDQHAAAREKHSINGPQEEARNGSGGSDDQPHRSGRRSPERRESTPAAPNRRRTGDVVV
jgi:hypothetical protein